MKSIKKVSEKFRNIYEMKIEVELNEFKVQPGSYMNVLPQNDDEVVNELISNLGDHAETYRNRFKTEIDISGSLS